MASAEAIVVAALKGLVPGPNGTFRVYPDVAPAGAVMPYITYQGVGGQDETTFDGLNTLQNKRMQINVWAAERAAAAALEIPILQALTAAPVLGTPIGAPVSVYEDDTKLFGSRLDISIWFNI
jgi:hypothetical protein